MKTKKNTSNLRLSFLLIFSMILLFSLSACSKQDKNDQVRKQKDVEAKETVNKAFTYLRSLNECDIHLLYEVPKEQECPALVLDNKSRKLRSYYYDEKKAEVVEQELKEDATEKILAQAELQLPFNQGLKNLESSSCELILSMGGHIHRHETNLNLKNELKEDKNKAINNAIIDLISYRGESLDIVTAEFLKVSNSASFRSTMAKVLSETVKAKHQLSLSHFLNVLKAPESQTPISLKQNLINLLTELDKAEVLDFAIPQLLRGKKSPLFESSEEAFLHFGVIGPSRLLPLIIKSEQATPEENKEEAILSLEKSYKQTLQFKGIAFNSLWRTAVLYNFPHPSEEITCKMRLMAAMAVDQMADRKAVDSLLQAYSEAKTGSKCRNNLSELTDIMSAMQFL